MRIKRGSADGSHRLELKLDRAANGLGWDEVHDLGTLSGTVSNIETDVDINKGDKLDIGVSVNFHGFVATISYETDRVTRLGAPDRIAGWNELLNPNVPGSPPYPEPGYDNPPNPRRTCLDLWNRRRPWHPYLNSVIWRAMCP